MSKAEPQLLWSGSCLVSNPTGWSYEEMVLSSPNGLLCYLYTHQTKKNFRLGLMDVIGDA